MLGQLESDSRETPILSREQRLIYPAFSRLYAYTNPNFINTHPYLLLRSGGNNISLLKDIEIVASGIKFLDVVSLNNLLSSVYIMMQIDEEGVFCYLQRNQVYQVEVLQSLIEEELLMRSEASNLQ
jgi:hypothetical protein